MPARCAVGAGRDRVEQLPALDCLSVAGPLKDEFAAVDAARDLRRQNNRSVNPSAHSLRPPNSRRTAASARTTVVTARQIRKKRIAASVARGMKTCRRRKPLDARPIGRQVKDGPERTALENLKP